MTRIVPKDPTLPVRSLARLSSVQLLQPDRQAPHRFVRSLAAPVVAIILGATGVWANPASAAGTYFLFLDVPGIPGESTAAEAPNQIEVLTWSLLIETHVLGGNHPLPKVSQPCGGKVVSAPDHLVSITKPLDKATPLLLAAVAQGTVFPIVTLHLFDAATLTEVATMQFIDAIFTMSHVNGDIDHVPSETLTLGYTKSVWNYVKVGDPGTTSTAVFQACRTRRQTD